VETGEVITVETAGERITAVQTSEGQAPADVWLIPGLFDIQVNGYGGYDFNGSEVSPEVVANAVRRLWQDGVTQLCPTVITGSCDDIMASLRAIAAACRDPLIAASIPCIHLEGPYIAPEDGARGAHPREHVRPPNWDEFQRWQEAAEGRIGLVTLAPEVPGGLAFIEQLTATRRQATRRQATRRQATRRQAGGVVAAIGHTAATPAQIRDAVAAGARLSTHLGNGSHALLPRHPNYIWEQAAADELSASLILDGHHLPPAVARCLVRCKGIERTILVSDAIAAAGLPPGRYRLQSAEVEVSPEMRCSLAGTPYLAGSVIALRMGVANAVRFAQVSPAAAVRMATRHPAQLLGLDHRLGEITVGREASLVVCRWQPWVGEIEVLATVVAGHLVWGKVGG
jgi:N-acetylglucosamine-6-phosphate deacetylase